MQSQQLAEEAYTAIQAGGLSLVKTDVGYTLLGYAEASVRKMYVLKERPFTTPCLAAGNIEVLTDIAPIADAKLLAWLKDIQQQTIVTVINKVNPQSKLLAKLSSWVCQRIIFDGAIGLFLNGGECIDEMVTLGYQDDCLLIGSSGNAKDTGNSYHFANMPNAWLRQLDFFADQGDCKYQNAAKSGATIINLVDFSVQRIGANAELIINSFNTFAEKNGFPKLVN